MSEELRNEATNETTETGAAETTSVEASNTEVTASEPAVVEEPKAVSAPKKPNADDEDGRGIRKVREGIVVSTAMDKTIVVNVERLVRHKRYGKVIARGKKVKAHDEKGACAVGDLVRIMETRPLSKTKCWRYIETIRKAVVV